MTRRLDDYLGPIRPSAGEELKICAYSIDGGIRQHKDPNQDLDMAKHAGLSSCPKCDYFYVNKETVYLIECTDIPRKKEDWTMKVEAFEKRNLASAPKGIKGWTVGAEALRFIASAEKRDEIKDSLFEDSVVMENILKIYGSLVVFYRFAQGCERMREAINDWKYEFILITKAKEHFMGMEMIENKLSKKAKDTMNLTREARKNAATLISKVIVIPYAQAEELERALMGVLGMSNQGAPDADAQTVTGR